MTHINCTTGPANQEAGIGAPQTLVPFPATALEFLLALEKEGTARISALRTQVSTIGQNLGKAALYVTLEDIHDIKPRLRGLLEKRRLSENSIQAYVFEANRLLRLASERGWVHNMHIPEAWKAMFEQSKEKDCLKICRYAAANAVHPTRFTSEDIDRWIAYRMQDVAWHTAYKEALRFKKLLVANGAHPKLGPLQKEDYGVAYDLLPESLRQEMEDLLRWKTASVAKGRKKSQKIRATTTRSYREALSLIYGYATANKGVAAASLRELIAPDVMYDFVSWSLDDRGVCGFTVHQRLAVMLALFRQHPSFVDFDVDWLAELVNDIPLESETEQRERRAAKQIPYADIERVAPAIRSTRKAAAKKGPKRLAWVVQLELLITLLKVSAWRQRNLREARITGPAPNIFKGSLRNTPSVAKRKWVQEMLEKDPNAEFWQFKFAPHETKNGRGVHGLIPKQIVPLLEEFVGEHRHLLLGDERTDTLFLSTSGTSLERSRVTNIVGEATLRHAGRRVTPHTFRHIVAYAFLDSNSKDYLKLSKILWHANVNTTIRIYGSTFNESNGSCAMEEWLEDRDSEHG